MGTYWLPFKEITISRSILENYRTQGERFGLQYMWFPSITETQIFLYFGTSEGDKKFTKSQKEPVMN